MKNYSVRMIREHMENIPQFPIPTGFAMRNYRPDEGAIWTRIQRAAEPYFDVDDQLFAREFKRDFGALEDRSFYLTTDCWRRGRNYYGVVAGRFRRPRIGARFTGLRFTRTIRDAGLPSR